MESKKHEPPATRDTFNVGSLAKISVGEARSIIGDANMNRVQEMAAPGRTTETIVGMGQTIHDHPVRIIGGSLVVIGGTLALPINPNVGRQWRS